jgi:hypothetical protein
MEEPNMSLIQVKGNQEVLTPTQKTEINSNFTDGTVSIEFESKKRIEPDHIFPHNECHLEQVLL